MYRRGIKKPPDEVGIAALYEFTKQYKYRESFNMLFICGNKKEPEGSFSQKINIPTKLNFYKLL